MTRLTPWLILLIVLLTTCAPPTPAADLPLDPNRPTFIFFYTDP